ncbi:helix-turn-helix transcriptional regulator [Flavobacterium sp. ANB]|uniref:helix-turn-helix domain-containing protein n=1 Tax=unclassified Flavobacterium TaxID=196869 RepID=UPI0012B8E9B4|nr:MULTISPECIES: AraC family transcriptional regulator [unclassified Flavobacterium]MBF4516649.1 helix-turn-helix transcriptional regulator [Flavobacterium sp. ANB]MTD69455.1 helix-turn-helix domain-containing protein [Flavobacterium sp. LC2016-13]
MKIVEINTERINNIFEELALNVGGKVTFDLDEYTLEVNNNFAKGSIIGSSFNDDISYIQFDMTFAVDVRMNITNLKASPVYFAYCSKGNLSHSFGILGEERKLKTFQTAILSSKEDQEHVLFFEKDTKTKFTLIIVGTQTGNKQTNCLNEKVKETFFDENTPEDFFYLGSYNLRIAEKIEQLNAINQKGIVRNLLKEGILRIILAMEIQQHTDDLLAASKDANCLTLREMEEIKELSEAIKANPEEAFTIKSLSKRSGLSPNKLQEGFKMIHNRTVNDYITHMRVLKAEILIRTSDLNISEIVYCIGFTSRSYFSKIFKQKFNCSPKEYKFNLNPLAITA